jgi:hypothetical protein
MRTIIAQGHSQNLRDLVLNYGLDAEGIKIIDFTFGTGSMWKTDYPYRFKLTKTDAVPTAADVVEKDLLQSDYSDLGMHDAGVFDPPYLYGHSAFDYSDDKRKQIENQNNNSSLFIPTLYQGKKSWGRSGHLARFTGNKDEREFIDRVKGLNRASLQCLKKDGLLFVKVMDTMNDGYQIANHIHCVQNLTNFKLYATFVYLAGGAKTWKSHAETSHGFWIVMKLKTDAKQKVLP